MAIHEDGFSTKISFTGLGAGTEFFAQTVTPPAMNAGGANDVTSMENTAWRTKASKKLIDMGDVQATGFYNASLYSTLVSQLGVNQQITIEFPLEGSNTNPATLVVYGWLDAFEPQAHEEGSAPQANITIVISNRDGSGAEIAPAYTAGS